MATCSMQMARVALKVVYCDNNVHMLNRYGGTLPKSLIHSSTVPVGFGFFVVSDI